MTDKVLEVKLDAELTLHMDVSDGSNLQEAVENILENATKVRWVDDTEIREAYTMEEY